MATKEYFQEYYRRNRARKLEQSKEYARTRKGTKSAYDRARRQQMLPELNEYDRLRAEALRGSASQMLARARQRARKGGFLCTITLADIVIPDVCPVLGIPIFAKAGSGGGDNSPSLDKIDPQQGYIPGNVAVISNRANRIKSDASLSEMLKVCEWLARVQENPNV